MKTWTIVLILIPFILIAGIVITGLSIYLFPNSNSPTSEWENAEELQISFIIQNLQECFEEDSCENLNLPPKEDLEKLKIINLKEKIEICKFQAREPRDPKDCSIEEVASLNCKEIFSTSFEIVISRPNPIKIKIHECGDVYYYEYERVQIAGPPEKEISKINLPNYIVDKLKS